MKHFAIAIAAGVIVLLPVGSSGPVHTDAAHHSIDWD